MKHKDGLDIAALLLLLLVAIAAMVVPVALTQPALLAVPAVLVLIALCVVLYQRRRLRTFLARQLCSTDFENSRIQYSLANLPIPTVLINDGRILWYNQYFRQDVLEDYDAVTRPVDRVLPELDLAVCSRPHGQDLKVGERRFTAYAGSAKGSRGASLVYLINDTLYKETLDEYNESRPACLIIVIDSYDELFDDMKDSEQAKAKGISELTGTCTAQEGTIWYTDCLPQVEGAQIMAQSESAPAMIMAVETGSVDFICTDMPTAMGACATYSDLAILDFSDTEDNFKVDEGQINIGISVVKGNTELKDAMDKVLAPLNADIFNAIMNQAIAIQPTI